MADIHVDHTTSGSSFMSWVVGLVVIVAVLALLWWIFLSSGSPFFGDGDTTIVTPPGDTIVVPPDGEGSTEPTSP
jgi:hypothetical protein